MINPNGNRQFKAYYQTFELVVSGFCLLQVDDSIAEQ